MKKSEQLIEEANVYMTKAAAEMNFFDERGRLSPEHQRDLSLNAIALALVSIAHLLMAMTNED